MAILEAPQLQDQALPPSLYTFLTALSAAVIVQLNISHDEPSLATDPPDSQSWDLLSPRLTGLSPDVFIAQCLEARRNHEFIEDADEWTILTSFFLFEHYGNCNQSKFAWYYLREAIGFAQSLGLDDPDTYIGLDTDTSQRRRVLFWLLFVTERYGWSQQEIIYTYSLTSIGPMRFNVEPESSFVNPSTYLTSSSQTSRN